ncbi:hypothetical protein ACFWG5_34260 [Streptomyces hydrogenans]|uniref:hypothetical protein n=1 Tax=Streptomyces TaxID=1883 RepID=UPI00362AD5F7
MSVLTTTRHQAEPLAYYEKLDPLQQRGFDTAIEHANDACTAASYNKAMRAAGIAIGIALPDGAEITQCACQDCYCDAIFDTFGPDLIVIETTDYGVQRFQCADCADKHPVTPED